MTSARRPRGGRQPALVRPLTLVAFGGNALLQPQDLGTVSEQHRRAAEVAAWLVDLVRLGHDVLVVHGNGPQVGQVLIQMEEGATKVPPSPLDVAVAQTEGSIGYVLERGLRNRLRREGLGRDVVTVLSMVVVDADDPGFKNPTKPIGPFFSSYRASVLRRELGWEMVEDSGRGWRKVVASPKPLEVLGVGAVHDLLARGALVIAAGGGGIPVVRQADGEIRGVEAVIDKDRTAAVLGRELKADVLVILTAVPHVFRDYGKKTQRPLPSLSVARARRLLARGQFPPGSMGPKIEAAVEFVEATGRRALITDADHLHDAVAGAAGTEIIP